MRFDLAEELDHCRLETRFARISIGDHRLNVDGYDEPIGSDQPRSLNSLAWGYAWRSFVKKVYRDRLGKARIIHRGAR
jgi:hypothetical protein